MTGVQTCALPISKTLLEVEGKEIELTLKEGQAIIINNKNIRHARKGPVGDRLLLRIWIEEVK